MRRAEPVCDRTCFVVQLLGQILDKSKSWNSNRTGTLIDRKGSGCDLLLARLGLVLRSIAQCGGAVQSCGARSGKDLMFDWPERDPEEVQKYRACLVCRSDSQQEDW